MKLWTHLLLAALAVCQFTSAQSASATPRMQWQGRLHTGILPSGSDAAWQAADKVTRCDLGAGVLRIHCHKSDALYLALRQVGADGLSIGVQ